MSDQPEVPDETDETDGADEPELLDDSEGEFVSVDEFFASAAAGGQGAGGAGADELIRSGFVTLVGRPNVGKSTLMNFILGTKVSITSDKPQTTRHQIRGILNDDETQLVFVDTPGIHRPRTLMGERLNQTATEALGDVDVVCLLIDATRSGRATSSSPSVSPRTPC